MLVLLGDGGLGKTSLMMSFLNNQFPNEHKPNVLEETIVLMPINGKQQQQQLYEFCLIDTGGIAEEYEKLWPPLLYPGTDVFLAMFSVNCVFAHKRAITYRIPEIKRH